MTRKTRPDGTGFDRSRGEVRTSWRLYDLLMIACGKEPDLISRIHTDIIDINHEVAQELKKFCAFHIARFRGPADIGMLDPDSPCCSIEIGSHHEALQSRVPLYQGSRHEQALRVLKERINACGDHWNSPLKIIDCPQRLEHGRHIAENLCFGTIDSICMFASPSNLWSNVLRMELVSKPWVSGLMNMPVYRVKYSTNLVPLEEKNHMPSARHAPPVGKSRRGRLHRHKVFGRPRLAFHRCRKIPRGCLLAGRHPWARRPPRAVIKEAAHIVGNETPHFVLYTFLHSPPNLVGYFPRKAQLLEEMKQKPGPKKDRTPPCLRKDFLTEIIDFFLPAGEDKPDIINLLKREGREFENEDPNFELFLTLSCAFPVVIKSEFKNLAHAQHYLKIIRRHGPWIRQTSTLMSWHDSNLYKGLVPEGEDVPEGVRLKILIKVEESWKNEDISSDAYPPVIKQVISRLRDELKISSVEPVVFGRPYYWDYGFIFTVKRLSRMFQVLANEINGYPEIVHMATVPVWIENKPSQNYEQPETVDDAQSGDKNGPPLDLSPAFVPRDYIEKFPASLPALIRGSDFLEVADENILNFRLEQLKKHYRWLLTYVRQMRKSWMSQPVVSRGQELRQAPSTFDEIAKFIIKKLESFPAKSSTPTKDELWALVRKESEKLEELRNYILLINSEFNERIRGHQAVTLNEHFVHMGEYNGAMDMVLEACARLFRHYCSHPHESSSIWSDPEKKHFRWNGVTVSRMESAMGVHPVFQILLIPTDIKLNTDDRLVRISHEAAHQVLKWIGASKTDSSRKTNAFKSFHERLLNPFIRDVENYAWSKFSIELGPTFRDIHPHRWTTRHGLPSNEWLADLLALLTAGPAYLRGLMHHLYSPSLTPDRLKAGVGKKRSGPGHKDGIQDRKYPDMWLRIECLRYVCRRLGWFEVEDQFHIEEMVRAHFAEYEEFDLADRIDSTEEMKNLVDIMKDHQRLQVELFCYLWLREDDSFLWKLLRWSQLHGTYFLYYPFPVARRPEDPTRSLDHLVDQDLARARADYEMIIPYINQKVGAISDRMMFNDEVIMEAPLKYIVASSMLPEHNHPHYCMGRLIHSLYYSHTHEAGFINEMKADLELDFEI